MTSSTSTATCNYEWTDADQTSLKRTDAEGNVAWVPTDPGNRDYAEFLSSGATAAPYDPPVVALPEPTTEDKAALLLSDYGLSREELRSILLAD